MATRTDVDAQLMREVLDDHEQALMRHVARGKSLHVIAQLYRQYEGENGVMHRINEIRAKLKTAAEQRAMARELGLEDDPDDTGGIPVRTVPASESMNGAGGANGHVAVDVPPAAAPPASSSRLPAVVDSPAPRRQSNAVIGMERERAVLEILARGPATAAAMVEEIGCSPTGLDNALARMRIAKTVVRSGKVEGRGGGWIYTLPSSTALDRPAPEPPPARTTEARPVPEPEPEPLGTSMRLDAIDGRQPLPERYAEVLIIMLEGFTESDEDPPVELMDRIERVLGIPASPTPTD